MLQDAGQAVKNLDCPAKSGTSAHLILVSKNNILVFEFFF